MFLYLVILHYPALPLGDVPPQVSWKVPSFASCCYPNNKEPLAVLLPQVTACSCSMEKLILTLLHQMRWC